MLDLTARTEPGARLVALAETLADDCATRAAGPVPAEHGGMGRRGERAPRGRKVFCTMAPAATVLFTAVTFIDDHGRDRYGYARVPAGTLGANRAYDFVADVVLGGEPALH